MYILITYSIGDLKPNDGFDYDEYELARDITERIETEINATFPDVEIIYRYPRDGYTKIFVCDDEGHDDEKTQERIDSIIGDIYQDTDWEKFLTDESRAKLYA